MTLLTYESSGTINPQWSILAFFGLGAGLLNGIGVVAALACLDNLDSPRQRILTMLALLLEITPIVFLGLVAVARIMQSRGKLRGLLPAAIGSFLACGGGLLVVTIGFAYAAKVFLPFPFY